MTTEPRPARPAACALVQAAGPFAKTDPCGTAQTQVQGKDGGPRRRQARPLWQGALIALPLVAAGWIATLAAVALVSDASPARFVLLPPQSILDDLPEAKLLGAGGTWVTLASDQPGFTRALYRAGALLVLPAGLDPCAGAPRKSARFG